MKGGLVLPGKKEATSLEWKIKRPRTLGRVRIPLGESEGGPVRVCVAVGDAVRTGQKIGEPKTSGGVFVHASVTGKVTAISRFPHPVLEEMTMVEIVPDPAENPIPGLGEERKNWRNLRAGSFLEIFREAGLVDMDAASRPLHRLVSEYAEAGTGILILNACESEPYLTSDYALTMSHPLDILKGAEILRRVSGAEKVVMATEDSKLELAEVLKSKIYFLKWKHFDVLALPSRYPQGHNSLLMGEVMERVSGSKTTAAVCNVATAFAVFEAVAMNKPLYERAVTVGGECVMEPKNLWLRIGSSFADAITACRGFLREPGKLLMGGPMTGLAQTDKGVSVHKGTQGILALPPEAVKTGSQVSCIRCGRCIDVCPAGISPAMIGLAVDNGLRSLAKNRGAGLCVECGACSYVCPSKRPVMKLVRQAADKI